jgi:hypothetical protein
MRLPRPHQPAHGPQLAQEAWPAPRGQATPAQALRASTRAPAQAVHARRVVLHRRHHPPQATPRPTTGRFSHNARCQPPGTAKNPLHSMESSPVNVGREEPRQPRSNCSGPPWAAWTWWSRQSRPTASRRSLRTPGPGDACHMATKYWDALEYYELAARRRGSTEMAWRWQV